MKFFPAICVSVGNEYRFVYPADIMYLSSDSSYTHLYLKDNTKIIISKHLKDVESSLPDEIFLRVHNSYLINLIYVAKYSCLDDCHIELTNGVIIPLARRKKSEFLGRFIKL